MKTSSNVAKSFSIQVRLVMSLWWQFLCKHEQYIEMLRAINLPVSSNVDCLDVDEDGTLVIFASGDIDSGNIKVILVAIKNAFPQITATSIPGKKVKCLGSYLDELQRHIDVDFFLEHERDLVHIVFDVNKNAGIDKNVDEMVSVLQKHENCEFKIFETPACVGRMVQDKLFKDNYVLETHTGTELIVQTYSMMEKTIISAIVPCGVSLSPEKVFGWIYVMLQYHTLPFKDLKWMSHKVPLLSKVIEQFLDQKYGDSGVVFWDVVPKSEEIIFCCSEEVNADIIWSSIKTDLVVVNTCVVECNVDISSLKQKCDIIAQHKYVFEVVVKQSRKLAQAFDIFVYCCKENKANVEKQLEDILMGIYFHQVSLQDVVSQESQSQQAHTAGASDNGGAGKSYLHIFAVLVLIIYAMAQYSLTVIVHISINIK